jgi:hypothetical protein
MKFFSAKDSTTKMLPLTQNDSPYQKICSLGGRLEAENRPEELQLRLSRFNAITVQASAKEKRFKLETDIVSKYV